jgi:cell division protein FtsL
MSALRWALCIPAIKEIEQGWLADASQIEKTARGVLQMQQPAETHILVVRP